MNVFSIILSFWFTFNCLILMWEHISHPSCFLPAVSALQDFDFFHFQNCKLLQTNTATSTNCKVVLLWKEVEGFSFSPVSLLLCISTGSLPPTVFTTCWVCGSVWQRRSPMSKPQNLICWRPTLQRSPRPTSLHGWSRSTSSSGKIYQIYTWSALCCIIVQVQRIHGTLSCCLCVKSSVS